MLVSNVFHKEARVTTKSVYKSKTYDHQNYDINLSNFDVAFGLVSSDGEPHLREKLNIKRYLKIEVAYFEYFFTTTEDGERVPERRLTMIPMVPCDTSRFGN